MRIIAILVAAYLALQAPASLAQSQQPIRIIVTYAPGGLIDVMNRIMAAEMSKTLNQPVIIENRPGANSNIGAAYVAQAVPDGHTVLASTSFFTINPFVKSLGDLHWNPKQLTPVAGFAFSPSVFVVSSKSPAKTMKEFLAIAKAKPGMPIAEAGQGASQTVVNQLLFGAAGVKYTSVYYKGGVSYIPDLINGLISGTTLPINVVLSLINGGQLRALAITSEKRSALLPDVPTMAELGFPDAGLDSWLGYHIPIGTPPAAIKRLEDAVKEAAMNKQVEEKIAALGARSAYLDTTAFKAVLQDFSAKIDHAFKLMNTDDHP